MSGGLFAGLVLPALFQGVGARDGVWPTTVAGWLALVFSAGSLIVLPYTFGRWSQRIINMMNGIGRRVAEVEGETKLQGAFQQEEAKRRTEERAEARHVTERVKTLEVNVESIEKTAVVHHQEQRALMLTIGDQQKNAVHELAIKLERLSAQNDLGEQMGKVCQTIERGFETLGKRGGTGR